MAVDYETQMDYHWRNTMKPVRFFMVDARVAFFLMMFILHMRIWTFFTFVAFMLFFWYLERRGLSFGAALRTFRTWILGRRRPAWLWIRRRKFHDYG
jgi:intracellular multiplication protein IcmT